MENEIRIDRAITALEAGYPEKEDNLFSRISDLLTDLMHFARQQGIEFSRCLLVAEINFESEK